MSADKPCPAYSDLRLARVYDPLNPMGPDNDFHMAVAGDTPIRILDVGCGTGRFAVELARRGHRVTGAEPAAGMIAIARQRPNSDLVQWIESDAAGLDLPNKFDLAIMTGHVFQVFVDDETTLAALRGIRRHLAPGGRLSFESRNPLVRDWETWTPHLTAEQVDVPDESGPIHINYSLDGIAGDIVTYSTHFRFADGAASIATSRLRFPDADRIAALLGQSGFEIAELYGDWDRSAFRPDSPEIIVVARAV